MSEIAKAYVQIVPSAKGMKQGLSGIFGSEMPAAGNSAGGIFGSALVGKIKGVIAGAGFGAVLKTALTAGGDLQQSLGGIETLFKENAATVIANAERAYKTAGTSANGYMEQVTSFSASLLQSLSGDTAKAASVADMAMTDMSDNANKMGTDMELIANAYQGFAKQNYTMLDNLKLGYGGTKTEMERLLADAEKLSGVKYDISNLSDVYSAIHVIQEELGITGTTALEASATLTGSFNAMKAAATDVLGNLALGKSIEPSLKALAETTTTFLLNNLVPAVWNIITALPGALVTFINAALPDNMESVVSTMVDNLAEFVTNELPNIFDDGARIITEITTGFLNGIPEFLEAGSSLLKKLLVTIIDTYPDLLESGVSLVLNMVRGILNSAPDIVNSGVSILADLLATIASHLPDMLTQGIALIGELVAGLISEIPNVISAAGDLVSNAVDAFLSYDWKSLGSDLIAGVVQGITDGVGSIKEAAKEAANSALSAAKKVLGIASPSRRGRFEVGRQYPAGIALGIRDNAKLVYDAVDDIGENMIASSLRIGNAKLSKSGLAAGYGKVVSVVQNIYSEAKTAADLMQEARYQQELAVMFGV